MKRDRENMGVILNGSMQQSLQLAYSQFLYQHIYLYLVCNSNVFPRRWLAARARESPSFDITNEHGIVTSAVLELKIFTSGINIPFYRSGSECVPKHHEHHRYFQEKERDTRHWLPLRNYVSTPTKYPKLNVNM